MLANSKITEFLEKTASSTPMPGGGCVAALGAAAAASLSEMVANLTIGKKGHEKSEELMKVLAEKARNYRSKLIKDIDRDSDAFKEVMAAFKLPKNTENEKQLRRVAVQQALKTATIVPLSVANDAFGILEIAEQVVEKGNKIAVTDGAVAAMMARTAVLSALYNVKINLTSIKDEDFVTEVTKQVKDLEVETIEKEKEILLNVGL